MGQCIHHGDGRRDDSTPVLHDRRRRSQRTQSHQSFTGARLLGLFFGTRLLMGFAMRVFIMLATHEAETVHPEQGIMFAHFDVDAAPVWSLLVPCIALAYL